MSLPFFHRNKKNHKLERELRNAFKNNELQVYLQPRVDTSTKKLISAEALLRWEHPVWGFVSPNEFIPIAEDIGLINDLGDWVLERVCKYLADWERMQLRTLPISVNIVAQRFLRRDCFLTVTSILKQYNVDPKYIELEITESSLINYEKTVVNTLNQLYELGIKVALDDFGTGYSSLSHIKDFPINTIKIDRSFIQQINYKKDVEVIIKSLIFMAKELDLNIVAEGVETLEQYDFLRKLECKEIQGYLFSKPISEEEFQKLLNKSKLEPNIHFSLT
ncbi:putative bifunctional diguanylate cyclase/phosphodiesterase [Ureibacillus massiliensis]|uniref:putative bifunctional diguanylate cyclase/phosphodiesterase n=1 Tax=Ureibacillus massiliensis TaxID=292806 RepID=UPI00068B235E|nr:EAL domain-containing protein [Ureibacillus massiliensis]